ncbi:MAG: NifB/NifX family molybdenum-iron cluster-binding protein [Desulfuromusa sp.]|nr:NifB/NifX family molybdenum-iron cluster-binding protein [Desulfuromusa sp.]
MWLKQIRIGLLIGFFSLFLSFSTHSAENIASIAVAANGSEPVAMVSEKAGRAAYFLFFDGSGNFLNAKKNPFSDASGGSGPKAATFLSDNGVTIVVAKEFGTKMERALSSYKIEYISQTGVAHEIVQAITKKK